MQSLNVLLRTVTNAIWKIRKKCPKLFGVRRKVNQISKIDKKWLILCSRSFGYNYIIMEEDQIDLNWPLISISRPKSQITKNNNYKLYHFFEYQYIIEKFNKLFWQQENINFLLMFWNHKNKQKGQMKIRLDVINFQYLDAVRIYFLFSSMD